MGQHLPVWALYWRLILVRTTYNKAGEAIKDLFNGLLIPKDYPELQTVAAVRLAGILHRSRLYEQALNLLNSIKNPDAEKH